MYCWRSACIYNVCHVYAIPYIIYYIPQLPQCNTTMYYHMPSTDSPLICTEWTTTAQGVSNRQTPPTNLNIRNRQSGLLSTMTIAKRNKQLTRRSAIHNLFIEQTPETCADICWFADRRGMIGTMSDWRQTLLLLLARLWTAFINW